MTEAIVTLPDGRRAKISGPDRNAVMARVNELRGPTQESEPRSIGEQYVGGLETAANIASSVVAEPVAGLAGIAGSILPGDPGQGADFVEATRNKLTYEPRTEAGQQTLASVGNALQPVGEVVEGAREAVGDTAFNATGSPTAGAIGQTVPDAALMALPVVGNLLRRTKNGVLQARRANIGDKIKAGAVDNDTAKYLVDGAGLVQKDAVAKETIKQGFDEGVVAAIKGSGKADTEQMLKIVNRMERGKANQRFAATNRPSDIVGQTLHERVVGIKRANRKAGRQIDAEADKLKGQAIDVEPPVNQFIDDLAEMGIEFDNGKLNFQGSDLEGLRGPQVVLNKVVERMLKTKVPDAFDVHRMKRFIDEQVTFGKTQRGLSGRTERILKGLRSSLDDTLDTQFPSYNQANTAYRETIGALDALQDVAGKKMDLLGPNADKAIGTLSRRLLSNAQSRVNLLDAIDEINKVAAKHGATVSDDLVTQVMFLDELESVFGPVARTSLQGDIAKVGESAVRGGIKEAAVDAVISGAGKLRGVNEKAAFASIKKLLKEQLRRSSQTNPAPQPGTQVVPR